MAVIPLRRLQTTTGAPMPERRRSVSHRQAGRRRLRRTTAPRPPPARTRRTRPSCFTEAATWSGRQSRRAHGTRCGTAARPSSALRQGMVRLPAPPAPEAALGSWSSATSRLARWRSRLPALLLSQPPRGGRAHPEPVPAGDTHHGATSRAGLWLKNPSGRRANPIRSTGITGQSSGRGM